MKQVFFVSRWLLLPPAYLLFVAFYAVRFMLLFQKERNTSLWHLHFDLILFLASTAESASLCLLCAWIAPSFKKLTVFCACVASIAFSLNRWKLVLAADGF